MLVKSFALGLFSIISGRSIGYLLVRMCRGDTKIQNSGSTFGTRSQNIHLYIYTDSRWQDISTGVFVLSLEVKRRSITIFKSWQTCFLLLLIVKRSCSCHAIFSHDRKYCRFLRNRMKKIGWVAASITLPQVLYDRKHCCQCTRINASSLGIVIVLRKSTSYLFPWQAWWVFPQKAFAGLLDCFQIFLGHQETSGTWVETFANPHQLYFRV